MKYLKYLTLLMLCIALPANADSSMSKHDFLSLAFSHTQASPDSKKLWLDKALQANITKILGHPYRKLRLSYWVLTQADNQQQSVWILDEIGKEKPITFGVSVINGEIAMIKVLAFRESRGGEIQMQAFSEQFHHVGLDQKGQLNRHIDGITGATMSVNAMKKIARLAIVLHNQALGS